MAVPSHLALLLIVKSISMLLVRMDIQPAKDQHIKCLLLACFTASKISQNKADTWTYITVLRTTWNDRDSHLEIFSCSLLWVLIWPESDLKSLRGQGFMTYTAAHQKKKHNLILKGKAKKKRTSWVGWGWSCYHDNNISEAKANQPLCDITT